MSLERVDTQVGRYAKDCPRVRRQNGDSLPIHVLQGVRTSLGGGPMGKQGSLAWEGKVGWKGGLWEDGNWEGADCSNGQ